jgi:molecular chaperone GrpE (heat shock protein)|tara:strand:- start:343 stop:744 length:402 start_codon:yes stop_codon:yes gene_type:complete
MSNNQMKTLLESMDAISEYASTPTPFAMRVNALMRAVKQLAGARDDQQRAAAFKGVERKFLQVKDELTITTEDFEDATTEPDPMYADHQMMTHDLAGGLNKPKDSYAPTNGGDNPMSLEETKIQAELTALYKL